MQKMRLEYAQKLLNGGYAFGNRYLSCHDDLLVVECQDDQWFLEPNYYATKLKDGQLQVTDEGYVEFYLVTPVIDKNTRFC